MNSAGVALHPSSAFTVTVTTGYQSEATSVPSALSANPGPLAPIGGIGGVVGIASGFLVAIALPLGFFIWYRGRNVNRRKLNSDILGGPKVNIPELPVRTRSIIELPVRPSKSLHKPHSNDPTPIYPELKPNEISELDRRGM